MGTFIFIIQVSRPKGRSSSWFVHQANPKAQAAPRPTANILDLNGDIVALLESSYDGHAQNYFDNVCTLKIVNLEKSVYKSIQEGKEQDFKDGWGKNLKFSLMMMKWS